jgi:purine-nucleoside phosphorylase
MTGSAEIQEVADAVRRQAGEEPFALAVVLGSGLGNLAEEADPLGVFPYAGFAAFPPAQQVAGHAGRLVAGTLEGWRLLFFQGRHHLYEGLTARQVAVPVRIAHALGCRRLLLTNAAGGVNEEYRPGDFMLISDHLNLLGDNPLRGERRDPFIDLSGLYRQEFFPFLLEFARLQNIRLHRGVLAALPGPSYETPAEIRALRMLGADAVSMSTVPEAIMGRYLGLEVAGLSLIANAAAGLASAPLSHAEVLASGQRGASRLALLVRHLIALWLSKSASA